jgi:hypothetical protein
MRIISSVIAILFLSVVPTRAAGDDPDVTPAPTGFHALSRISEEAGAAPFPFSDDELAYITEARPRKVPPISPVRSRQLPGNSEVSRPIDGPSARARRTEETDNVKVESGVEAPPQMGGRSSVEEEPDPGAVIDWLLKKYDRSPRHLDMRTR